MRQSPRIGRRATVALAVSLVVATALALPGGGAAADTGGSRPAAATDRVIVRGTPGGGAAAARDAERAVTAVGGRVTRTLPIVDGVAAVLPAGAAARLRDLPRIVAVTPDATGTVQSVDPALGFDPATDTGSLGLIDRIVGADRMWAAGATGKGVDVAVIDTGVSPVAGLTSGNLVHGPDLSFDSQRSDLRHRDAYGHGTHMASIIAGRDTAGTASSYRTDNAKVTGVAPDARIVSLKVGAADGGADVSQVIAAINWVAENGQKNGLNIRVLNLSYGSDSGADYATDPLSYAAEVAWRKGIVVVVAAGNDGTTHLDLASPALNPNLLAVGAADPNGTVTTSDDTLPDFSNRGTSLRNADVVAPGTHVLGLRVPEGYIDQTYPTSRAGTRFTRGSGTSQATAVVAGAAALLLSKHATLTPNQVKGALTATATMPPTGTPKRMGAGVIDVARASAAISASGAAALAAPAARYGTGTGLLERSRGSSHVTDGTAVLTGEQDIFARSWSGRTWAGLALKGTTWSQGRWNGSVWTGGTWGNATEWATVTWAGSSWSGTRWSGRTWVGRTWVGNAWDGRTWVGESWAGRTWVTRLWSSASWT
jgi:serine protease AprX